MTLFRDLEENAKVVYVDGYAYLKSDDVKAYMQKGQSTSIHKSKSGQYIQIEINVPVDMINIEGADILGESGDYETDHDDITVDDCLFEIVKYDYDEINQLAFERWEKE